MKRNKVKRSPVPVDKYARFKGIILEQAQLNKVRRNRSVSRAIEALVNVLDQQVN